MEERLRFDLDKWTSRGLPPLVLPDHGRCYSAQDAATYLGLKYITFNRLRVQGKIPQPLKGPTGKYLGWPKSVLDTLKQTVTVKKYRPRNEWLIAERKIEKAERAQDRAEIAEIARKKAERAAQAK